MLKLSIMIITCSLAATGTVHTMSRDIARAKALRMVKLYQYNPLCCFTKLVPLHDREHCEKIMKSHKERLDQLRKELFQAQHTSDAKEEKKD